MSIIKTNLCLIAVCKCGGVVAASMLWGGVSLDEDFITTVAEVHNDGGSIEIVNTENQDVTLSGCICK